MSTSQSYQQVSALNKIAAAKPKVTSGVVNGVWDDLLKLIGGVIQPIIDTASTTIGGWITGVKTTVENTITDVKTWINNNVVSVVNTVSTALTNGVNTIIAEVGGVVDDVITGVNNALGGIGDAISDAIGWIVDKLTEIVDGIRNIGQTIGNIIAGAISSVVTGIRNAFEGFAAAIGSFLGGIIEEVRNWFGGVIEGIKNAWNTVTTAIGNWVTNAYNTVKTAIETTVANIVTTYEGVKKGVEEWIANALQWLANTKDSLVKWFWQTVTNIGAWINKEVIPRFDDAIEGATAIWGAITKVWEMISGGNFQGAFDLVDNLFKGIGLPAPLAAIHSIVSAVAYFWETVHLQFIGMHVAAQKRAIMSLGLEGINLDAAAQAVFKGSATLDQYYQNAALSGITKERAKIALDATRALPTPGSVQTAYLRGEINESEHDRLLGSFGYTSENIDLFKSLYWLIPPPTDLIRMGVREVFTPEIAEKFGQYQDIPPAFLKWGEKIGLSKEWATNYWAAHWDLPSASMGYEMLHRGVITPEELTLLLRALDVMPFWREKLIQISYNPLTRVDVRRMYQLGVLNEDQVTRSYLDLGYDQEKAAWLTEFTIRYYAPEDQTQLDAFKDLARGVYSQAYRKKIISRGEYTTFLTNMKFHPEDVELLIRLDDFTITQNDQLFDLDGVRKDTLKLILAAYNDGLIDPETAKSMLFDLGYDNDQAETELSVVDYNRELATRKIIVDALHDQYTTYIIDEVSLHEIMGMFNFSGLEIDRLVSMWNIERSYRVKRPPLSDLRKFMDQGLITLDDFLNELRGLGYHEKYISLYSQSLAH